MYHHVEALSNATTTIETQLRSEIARATLAETSESNRAVAAESALLTNLESTNNRLSRETNQLSWKIANESMRAREAEQNETFRAIAAETAIEATLRSSIESDKASFISTIEQLNVTQKTLDAELTYERGRALMAEQTEVTRATNAESTILGYVKSNTTLLLDTIDSRAHNVTAELEAKLSIESTRALSSLESEQRRAKQAEDQLNASLYHHVEALSNATQDLQELFVVGQRSQYSASTIENKESILISLVPVFFVLNMLCFAFSLHVFYSVKNWQGKIKTVSPHEKEDDVRVVVTMSESERTEKKKREIMEEEWKVKVMKKISSIETHRRALISTAASSELRNEIARWQRANEEMEDMRSNIEELLDAKAETKYGIEKLFKITKALQNFAVATQRERKKVAIQTTVSPHHQVPQLQALKQENHNLKIELFEMKRRQFQKEREEKDAQERKHREQEMHEQRMRDAEAENQWKKKQEREKQWMQNRKGDEEGKESPQHSQPRVDEETAELTAEIMQSTRERRAEIRKLASLRLFGHK